MISEVVSSEIMSLPMNPYVTDEEIAYYSKKFIVIAKLNIKVGS